MPFIATANTLKCLLKYNWANQTVVQDLWFKYNSAPGSTERAALATAMHTWWTNQIKPYLCDNIGLFEVDVIDMSTQNGPVYTLTLTSPEVGGDTGDSVPLNAALCVSLRTASRGRNFRGRNYIGGIPLSSVPTPGTFATGIVSNILTAFSWFLTPSNVAAGIWSVVSWYLNKSARSSGLATPITAVTADTLIDSQRRRLIGRGQ